ncbi:tetratricopeptide repeat protein [Spirochaetia bacterium 38H-sp]|uniref:Tetratricopeptide repeat protein n=1 Tax=Rarispira pelagica TaxID=3141764 RepID=A0ABU9UCZ4_9SPIR
MGAKKATLLMLFILTIRVFSQNALSAPEFFSSAYAHYVKEDYYAAITDYKKAIEQNRFYADAYAGLADCYVALRDYKTALFYASKARDINPFSVPFLLLNARIMMLLGKLDEAASLIEKVKRLEPKNPEALLAEAELSIAKGDFSYALMRYQDALRIFPEHRGVLASLAILYDYSGDYESAKKYLDAALRLYPLDVDIYLLAAEYAAKRKDWKNLEDHARDALSIDNKSQQALVFLATAQIARKNYDDAIKTISELIGMSPDSPSTWYLDAMAKAKKGDKKSAIRSLSRLVEIKPDDELARFYLEMLATESLDIKDELRKRLADYHFSSAKAYKEKFLSDKAFMQYRYGLRLFPVDIDANLDFAVMLRERGFLNRYADRLNFLLSLGYSKEVADLKEVADITLSDDVSSRWSSDIFTIEPPSVSVFVALSENSIFTTHPFAGPAVMDALSFTCQQDRRINLIADNAIYYDWEKAFESARAQGVAFFALIEANETERFFSLAYKLYHAQSGRLVAQFDIRKSGNDRVFSAVTRLGEELIGALPFYATIAERKFDKVLINAGASSGLEVDTEFIVLDPEKVTIDPASGKYNYKESDILGTVKITALSDIVSEGQLTISSIFDMVNKGDMLIAKPVSEQGQEKKAAVLSEDSGTVLDKIISFLAGK